MTAHGDIIYENASLGPTNLSIGASGYVLTVVAGQPAWAASSSASLAGDSDVQLSSPSNGDVLTYVTADSKWENKPATGGGCALLLLEEHTASNSTELDFTAWYSSTYDEYMIEFNQIVPATNLANIYMQFSTNGGFTYDTGSNYAWVGSRQSVAGVGNSVGSNATSSFGIDVSGQVSSTASRGGLIATMRLYLSANGTIRPKIKWEASCDDGTSNIAVWCTAAGTYLSTTAVNAFHILASSGNLTSGTVRVYGLSH
jgi:hypothetical protein